MRGQVTFEQKNHNLPAMIDVQHLSYTYAKNTEPTVRDVNFAVEKGEIFGFLGPSGSGKSTTQKVLYKLLPRFEGEIAIHGKNLKEWGKEFYHHIGVSFELPNHYLKLTALENLRFFSTFYKKAPPSFESLLDMVGLKNEADKRVAEYSKGMKMRLNFIRSFMHDPEILFLDEPTAGLDPVNAKVIKDIILDLKARGKTIFITTHNMFDADHLCNRIALIIKGQIKAIDRPESLKIKYGQKKVQVQIEGQKARREFPLDHLGRNKDFLDLLANNDIKTIHSREASLEEVFIKITGESLT